MTRQALTHHTAGCLDCGASCASRNAVAWAHNHARRHGHRVELSLGYYVSPGCQIAQSNTLGEKP